MQKERLYPQLSQVGVPEGLVLEAHLLVSLILRMGTDGINRVQISSYLGKDGEVQAPDLRWLEILTRFQGRKSVSERLGGWGAGDRG